MSDDRALGRAMLAVDRFALTEVGLVERAGTVGHRRCGLQWTQTSPSGWSRRTHAAYQLVARSVVPVHPEVSAE